jgi:hypothetical protein
MAHPQLPDDLMPDGIGPRRRFSIPPGVPTPDAIIAYEVTAPEQLDRRLKGYYLVCAVSEPPPNAPNRSPVPLIPLHGHPVDGWQLWSAILRWPGSPVAGELRYELVYGWCSAIYYTHAPSREITRITHGLEVLQHRIPAPGRQKGARLPGIGPYTSLDGFLEAARHQRDRLRRNRDPVEKEILASLLNMSVRTLERALHKCRFTWEAFRDEP